MSDHVPSLSDEVDETTEKAETFLGGLRSELDEGSHLHPSFSSLSAAADAIRAGYLSFSITPQRAAEAFQLLRILDDNDIEWTVGPSSGSWYRRRQGSGSWQTGPAPIMAEPKPGHNQPWLSGELSEILPSARNSNKAGTESNIGSQAGIRIVEASIFSTELERESTDWLLSEWDALEVELENLQAGARPSVSIEDSAAWPVKQMFEKLSNSDSVANDISENLGLPTPDTTKVSETDMFDLFVKPDAPVERKDSVQASDILGEGPAVRKISKQIKAKNLDETTLPASLGSDSLEKHSTTSGKESDASDGVYPEHVGNSDFTPLQEFSDQSPDVRSKNDETIEGDDPYGI